MNFYGNKRRKNSDVQKLTEKIPPYQIDIGYEDTQSVNKKLSFIHPISLTSLFSLGMRALKSGNLDDAIVFFSRIIELDGKMSLLFFIVAELSQCKNT